MNAPPAPRENPSFFAGTSMLALMAFLKLAFHLSVNAFSGYGFFRDEFYYLACSEHLDWGFVDHPPLSIGVLWLARGILGDSLMALRLMPALAGAATVYLTGLMARELGGNQFSQSVAALVAFSAPILLAMNSVYSMNSFDFLIWSMGALLLLRLIKTQQPRLWIQLGLVLGLGLMNKVGVLWLGLGIFLGIMATHRSWLTTRWPWIAGVIALIVFLPYVLWNATHDLAHLEFIRNATGGKYSSLTPWKFISDQILLQNPAALPLWLAGLWYVLFAKNGKPYRLIGVVYTVAFVVLVLNQHSKAEYLAPAYPMLFAAGSVWWEQSSVRFGWMKPVLVGLIATSGILLAPLASPVLPVKTYVAYAEAFGVKPSTAENKELAELPQFYADMFGWEELTAAVVSVYQDLPQNERERCMIYTQNYGEAGAISFLGRGFGLPRVISGHNNYYLWGPGTDSIEAVIIVGGALEDHQQVFETVELVATTHCRYCMPYENNLPIFVARKMKKPIEQIWPMTKNYS